MEELNLIANKDKKSPIAEAYRTLRTSIRFSGTDKELKTIAVVSALPGEGKSTTISNLAVVIAQSGQRVLLMDCDLRKARQHKILGVKNIGLTNYLISNDSVERYIQDTEIENLDVMAAGPVPPNPSELLESKKFKSLLESVKEYYDYVLLDCTPVIPVADATIVADQADGVVILLCVSTETPKIAQEVKQKLQAVGANILGVVLNKVEIHHSYGYAYYYYGHEEK